MTLSQFKNIDESSQELLIWSKGVQIAARSEKSHHYLLYQLDGFYIEVQYSIPFNTITCFLFFDDVNLLDPYLDQVKISMKF